MAVTPGPGVVYIVTRTLAQGRRAGLASVAGVALGNFASAAVARLWVGHSGHFQTPSVSGVKPDKITPDG